jgi:hypothetical protein
MEVDVMLLLHAVLTAHSLAGHGHALADPMPDPSSSPTPGSGVPDPDPVAPPGLSGDVSTLLGWWKWIALTGGVFGLIGCGAMMAIGRRSRSALAADGATGIPWVLAGLTLIVTLFPEIMKSAAEAAAAVVPRKPASAGKGHRRTR